MERVDLFEYKSYPAGGKKRSLCAIFLKKIEGRKNCTSYIVQEISTCKLNVESELLFIFLAEIFNRVCKNLRDFCKNF